MSVTPLKTAVGLNDTYRLISYQSENTLSLLYKDQPFNVVGEIFAAHFVHCKECINTFCEKNFNFFSVKYTVVIVNAECKGLIYVLQ
jgi:hypothetical protein